MNFDLTADINNIPYLLYMEEQEKKERLKFQVNENASSRSDRPQHEDNED